MAGTVGSVGKGEAVMPGPTGYIFDPRERDRIQEIGEYKPFRVMAASKVDSGRGKTRLLHEAIRKVVGRDLLMRQEIGDCFVAGTMVAMADGSEKPIEDVVVGDSVVSPSGRPRAVLNTIRKSFTGSLVTISLQNHSRCITATEDHRFVAFPGLGFGGHRSGSQSMCRDSRRQWMPLKAIEPTVRLLVPFGLDANPGSDEDIPVPGCHYSVPESNRQLSSGRVVVVPRHQKQFKNRVLKKTVTLDVRLGRLIGLYLSEGGADNNQIYFCFGRAEEFLARETVALINSIFGVSSRVEYQKSKPTVTMVKCSSTQVAQFFKNLIPGNVYSKRLPSCVFRASRLVRMALLRGWMDGDGHTRTDCTSVLASAVSASEGLIFDFQRLAYSCGLLAGVTKRKQYAHQTVSSFDLSLRGENAISVYPDLEKSVRFKKCHKVDFGFALPVKRREERQVVNESVYCIEVEEEHSFIANGYAVHNCVSFGIAKAIMTRIALQVIRGTAKWTHEVATESLYGFGRVEIGKRQIGHDDGLVGMWAVDAARKYGWLYRKTYGSVVDLTRYSGRRAKEWGWTGVPDSLESEADDQLIVDFALLKSWEDFRDAIWNEWPCFICSSWLPGDRDSQGFAKRDGSGAHCEAATGMTDEGSRPGALIDGSWGAFNGPKGKYDIPDSAYWADAATIDKRIKEYEDSFCLKLMKASDQTSDGTDWSQI